MRGLAVKYRPRSLGEVVGQPVAVRVLNNSLGLKYVPNAFLLTGHHGVGKTTIARAIAKSIMCASGVVKDPCFDCSHCKGIETFSHPDVWEIDAASNTGVSDIRFIIENTSYVPIKGRFKVFIIDEVHMLSISAFNALLKTLEEPKPHVRFILATTELKKVPLTIVSRCQLLQLKKVDVKTIVEHLKYILEKEKIDKYLISEEALELIGRSAKGSLRDAISTLEQAILYSVSGEKVELEQISELLGMINPNVVVSILKFVLKRDAPALMEVLQNNSFSDPMSIIESLASLIYETLIYKLKGNEIEAEIGDVESEILIRLWQALINGIREIGEAPDAQLALEMLLIRLCFLARLPSISEIISRDQPHMNLDDSPIIRKIMESFKNAHIEDLI